MSNYITENAGCLFWILIFFSWIGFMGILGGKDRCFPATCIICATILVIIDVIVKWKLRKERTDGTNR